MRACCWYFNNVPDRCRPDCRRRDRSSQRTIEVVRQPTPDSLKVPSEPPREPQPRDALAASLKQAMWIWHDEPPVGAAVRYFRAVLDIPEGQTIKAARGILTCDNSAVLYVNGNAAYKTDDDLNSGWRNAVHVNLKPLLHTGRNVLAVRAENFDSQAREPCRSAGRLPGRVRAG